jgi:protein-S-isoprenylcysteine O-methyltransferase Ste14
MALTQETWLEAAYGEDYRRYRHEIAILPPEPALARAARQKLSGLSGR